MITTSLYVSYIFFLASLIKNNYYGFLNYMSNMAILPHMWGKKPNQGGQHAYPYYFNIKYLYLVLLIWELVKTTKWLGAISPSPFREQCRVDMTVPGRLRTDAGLSDVTQRTLNLKFLLLHHSFLASWAQIAELGFLSKIECVYRDCIRNRYKKPDPQTWNLFYYITVS